MKGKHWTKEEKDFLCKNWGVMSIEEIAKHLDRTVSGVKYQGYYVLKLKNTYGGKNQRWNEKEKDYLKDSWGKYKLSSIAKKLNRTENAILHMAYTLNLGEQVNWYTTREIQDMTGINRTSVINLINRYDLDHFRGRTGHRSYQMNEDQIRVMLNTVPHIWNYYNLTVDFWGNRKPQWLKDKIEADKNKSRKANKRWSEKEDFILLDRINNNISIDRIITETGRDYRSIKNRLQYKYNISI